ncbi:MAG: dihydropteroate synthase, partial [Endomicrobiia bacterium]|nr:dihydropteroate synthase [Endomicrobiia bacterium]
MFRSVALAIRDNDEKFIRELAASQIAAGADALDVNVGPASDEPKAAMKWLIETVQKEGDFRISIDTSSPEIMEAAVAVCKNRPILNSATASPEKLSRLAAIARRAGAELIALAMDEKG